FLPGVDTRGRAECAALPRTLLVALPAEVEAAWPLRELGRLAEARVRGEAVELVAHAFPPFKTQSSAPVSRSRALSSTPICLPNSSHSAIRLFRSGPREWVRW